MNLGACVRLRFVPINGWWYRALGLKHWPTRLSTEHSRRVASRFSAAEEGSPRYPTLYLGENHQVVFYEVGALLGSPLDPVCNPRGSWVVMALRVVLDSIADLSDDSQLKILRTSRQELTGPWEGSFAPVPTQQLGAALHATEGVEGVVFPSSKPLGRNLVIFPDKLGPRSHIVFHNELDGREERLTLSVSPP
jgi:hypothetical protein